MVDRATMIILLHDQMKSHKDSKWVEMKALSAQVAKNYRQVGYNAYAERITQCGSCLRFAVGFYDDELGEFPIKLIQLNSCHVRYCPICQWRRSVRWQAKAFEMLPLILDNYGGCKWLFLTLTVKNPCMSDLRDTVGKMNYAFKKWTKRKDWPALGWVRSLEVTRSHDDSAHCHFHCLLLVSSDYFHACYLTQREWTELWRKSMNLDYTPVVHVERVRDVFSSVPEILKYQTKPGDLISDPQWLLDLTFQMHGLRAVAPGGVLRDALRELGEEPEDLLGYNPDGMPVAAHIDWNWDSEGGYKSLYYCGDYVSEDPGDLVDYLM